MLSRTIPFLVVLVLACGGGERPSPAAPPQQPVPEPPAAPAPAPVREVLLRGTVRLQPVPRFRSCDYEVHTEFLDSTRAHVIPTYQLLGASEEKGLYLVARGALSPRGQVIVREIEFAGIPSETDGCEATAPAYLLLARGVNPAWQVAVTESGLQLTQADEPTRIDFPSVSPVDSGQVVVYATTAGGEGGHSLRLTLQKASCHEGNHIYAAMRAELLIDGRLLAGCAWRGRLP